MYEESKTEKPPWRWKIRVCWQRRRVLFTFYAPDFGAWETTTCKILTRRCHALAPYVAYNLNTWGSCAWQHRTRVRTCSNALRAYTCACLNVSLSAVEYDRIPRYYPPAGPACFPTKCNLTTSCGVNSPQQAFFSGGFTAQTWHLFSST